MSAMSTLPRVLSIESSSANNYRRIHGNAPALFNRSSSLRKPNFVFNKQQQYNYTKTTFSSISSSLDIRSNSMSYLFIYLFIYDNRLIIVGQQIRKLSQTDLVFWTASTVLFSLPTTSRGQWTRTNVHALLLLGKEFAIDDDHIA